MTNSCCFVFQYNTEAPVLVLQYYCGKLPILEQYQKILSEQSAFTAHVGTSDRVEKEIEIRRVSNNSLIAKHTKVTKMEENLNL